MCPTEESTGEELWRYAQMLNRAGDEFAEFLTSFVEGDDPLLESSYLLAGSEMGLSELQMTRLAEYLGLEETQEIPEYAADFESEVWLHRVRRSDIS